MWWNGQHSYICIPSELGIASLIEIGLEFAGTYSITFNILVQAGYFWNVIYDPDRQICTKHALLRVTHSLQNWLATAWITQYDSSNI